MRPFSSSLHGLLKSLWEHRDLLGMLTKREVLGRYRGSILGVFWSLINPLALLATYTFVFSVVFKMRWGSSGSGSKAEFALTLFIGLLIFNLFAECLNRAPNLITQHANYVKKVIFPLELLPWVTFLSALFHFVIGFGVWLLFFMLLNGVPSWSALLLGILLLPMLGFTVGITYLLATMGVCLRDMSQVVTLLTTILMFLSPIFYPASQLPAAYQAVVYCNPLTLIIEQARALLLNGQGLNVTGIAIATGCSLGVLWIGFSSFQRSRRMFADVL